MHLNGSQIFLLIGLICCLINIVIIMGPVNPLAAIGAVCYALLSLPYILEEELK
jgi:hypothetical protein